MTKAIHPCECTDCQQPDSHPNKLLRRQMNLFFSRLDEQQRRWYAGLEAIRLGRGGIKMVVQITGLDEKTVSKGCWEVQTDLEGRPEDRVRLPGGGRPNTEKKSPEMVQHLTEVFEGHTVGDPMSENRWVRLSLVHIQDRLEPVGCSTSKWTIARIIKENKYSLKANVKSREPGEPHKDQDTPFVYIAQKKEEYLQAGQPVISVDTKKKERVGNFKNSGRSGRPTPEQVNTHDFPSQALERATPRGIYDIQHNRGNGVCT